jgi:hypothetical protein
VLAGDAMIVRSLRAFGVTVVLVACTSEVPETVRDGHVRQTVDYQQYHVEPKRDVILVVNTGSSNLGTTLRESVAKALHDRARELAEGEGPWLRYLWNPLDVRGFVIGAGGAVRSPRDVVALGWNQLDASVAAADAFSSAASEEMARASTNEPRKEGVVDALHEALAAARTPADAARLIVIVSAEDDANAPAVRDPLLRSSGDEIVVVIPGSAPNLEGWARANEASIRSPSSELHLRTFFVDYFTPCLSRTTRTARCRVRALVPPGTACNASRGWRTPSAAFSAPSKSELLGMDSCEVVALEGDDLGACESGGASGWCPPAPTALCGLVPPRLVGGAAPPWATIEVACNLGE